MNPTFLVVDLFCGAGGTTTGFEMADGVAQVIACVNHDPIAIKSHWLNHPRVKHFNEDIRTLDLTDLITLCKEAKDKYPDAKLILWASLECTNFSKAKGGQARNPDSRTLADHLDRYVAALDPEYIQIENVVEFMSWGPLDDKGKPVSRKAGSDWIKWRNRIDSYGYYNQWKTMNAADYGAYTSRNRLFGCFAKHGLPIAWPEPTHTKKPSTGPLIAGGLKKWKAVKDVLDFGDEGKSIFGRKKDLSEKTLERIYAGLIKYVAGGKEHFLSRYYGGNAKFRGISLDEPAGTIRTNDGHHLVSTSFISKYYSGKPEGKNISVDGPAGTVTCIDGQALVNPLFLHAYYGNGDNNSSLFAPCPTLPTKDRMLLINASFINRDFTNGGESSSIEAPAGSVMPNPKLNLVTAQRAFVMPTNFDNKPTSIETPSPTITANRKHHYLVNPSWVGNNTSVNDPAPVIIARQDKAPLYLVEIEDGRLAIEIYDTDSLFTKKIKEFMALYGIIDIKMRMLKIVELLKIQGFPSTYILEGSQADQKKFIGNSVEPNVVKCWTLKMYQRLIEYKTRVA